MQKFHNSLFQVFFGSLFLFSTLYFVFFSINQPGLADNGYDAARFLNAALSGDLTNLEISFDQLVTVFIINKTIIGNFPFFCSILFFISILFLNRISVSVGNGAPPVWYFIFATPLLIVYLETGKDVIILTTMIFLFGFLNFWDEIRTSHSKIVIMISLSFLILLSILCFLVKGVTVFIYFALIMFMSIRLDKNSKLFLAFFIIIAAFFLGFEIRGPVDFLTVSSQTAFSSPHLISDDSIAKAFLSGLSRFFVYFTAPLWYWAVMFKNLPSSPGLIFHAYAYIVLSYGVLRFKFWRNINYILATALFSLSYPFVHLRYFFTFIVFWFLIKVITEQRWLRRVSNLD